jgi:hypothetical protein
MPDDNSDVSPNLRLNYDKPLPIAGPRPGGLRAAATAAKAPAQPPSKTQTEPMTAAQGRPGGVTAIAVWQLGRTLMTLLLFGFALSQPHWRLTGARWALFIVVSNGSIVASVMTPLDILIDAAVGLGLWGRQQWARWTLVVFSCFAVIDCLLMVLAVGVAATRIDLDHAAQLGVARYLTYALLMVNLMIALYLSFSSSVAEAFRKRPATPQVMEAAPIRMSGI